MFRFTIRDLLWLMVVVGMAVGWIVDNSVKSKRIRDLSFFEVQLINCSKMLRETIECIEAEGHTVETDTAHMYLERKSRPKQ
jgi:hypothetical protein